MAIKLDTLHFTMERETKNTIRYDEDGSDDEQAIGTLYVQKRALTPPWPSKLVVTIEVAP